MSRAHVLALIAFLSACSLAACEAPPSEPPSDGEAALAAGAAGDGTAHGAFSGVTFYGNGCDDRTAQGAISPDGQAVTALFSDLVASSGPGTEPGKALRTCIMQLSVEVPAGWSYTVNSADLRGFVSLDEGLGARRSTTYVAGGSRPAAHRSTEYAGPFSDSVQISDFGSGQASPGWSPCGRGGELWAATVIDLEEKEGSSGLVGIDSHDVELAWRRCR